QRRDHVHAARAVDAHDDPARHRLGRAGRARGDRRRRGRRAARAGPRRRAGRAVSDRFRHDMTFGAALRSDGRARFALWAPDRDRVELAIEGAAPLAMAPQDDGWHVVEARCAPDARYRYRFADGLAVPDPAARAQDGDVHGPSVVVDPLAY